MLDCKRSTGYGDGRNMARDYGVKSRPVSTQRGTPTGWSSTHLNHGDEIKVFQSQIILQAPDGQRSPKRGLSGSKIRKSSSTSRSGSQTPRSSYVPDHNQELLAPATPTPQSLTCSAQFLVSMPSFKSQHKPWHQSKSRLLVEDGSGLLSNYKWNNSDQSLRLQRELSMVSSSRAIKRASEMGSRRIDPMYCLYGSKLSLLSRYGADYEKMARQYDMTPARERMKSDGMKMKVKCDSRPSNSRMQKVKQRPRDKDTSSASLHKGTCPETESGDTSPTTKPNNVPVVIGSSDVDQEAVFGDMPPATQSSGVGEEKVFGDIPLVTGFSDTEPETKSGNISPPPTESSDIDRETESNDILPASGSSETNPETESSDILPALASSETNPETESSDIPPS